MTSPTRILCISRAYGEHAGGMERLSFELLSELKRNTALDVHTIVHETKPGASLFAARVRSLLFVASVIPKALFESKDVDVVHIGDPVLSLVGWFVMRLRNIPIVVTVHGLDVAYANPLYQIYLKLFFGSFAQYVAISEYAKLLLVEHGISKNVIVITPGVRDSLYDGARTRNELGRLLRRNISNMIVFATTGRLVKRKGHMWVIKNIIPKLPKNSLYVIAGSGPESDTIADEIKSLKIEDRVVMLGRISNEDQKTLLNTIDAFIQPNIVIPGDGEGFGIAPLEAALCKKPVFASNVDGIPSAIHHGKNGILLVSKETTWWINALTAFVQNPALFHPQGEEAREYTLKTFSWDTIATEYERTLREMLKS